MSRNVPSHTLAIDFILLLSIVGLIAAEEVKYQTLPREVVETRLGKYAGSNKQREATLKKMFAEAGCADHLSEQAGACAIT
jgi:hypothetical protein